jgi:hypothetical protein
MSPETAAFAAACRERGEAALAGRKLAPPAVVVVPKPPAPPQPPSPYISSYAGSGLPPRAPYAQPKVAGHPAPVTVRMPAPPKRSVTKQKPFGPDDIPY